MAPTSFMKVKHWREDKTIKVIITKPVQKGYFMINSNESECSDNYESLMYFDNDFVKFDFKKFQSECLKNHIFLNNYTEIPANIRKEPLKLYLKWIRGYFATNNLNKYYFTSNSNNALICTTLNLLSSVMNTPFEINCENRKWSAVAKVINNVIDLFPENNTSSRAIAKHYEMMKKNLFTRNLARNVISTKYEQSFEIYQRFIGNHNVMYIAETPAIVSKQRVKSSKELKAAEHLMCDIFKTGEFSREVISYNPIWWAKAELINARHGFIGMYNERKDYLQGLIKFSSDKFVDKLKYVNLWSPDAAWYFLDLFLQFVKDEVNKIKPEFRNRCMWQFKSLENDIECVSCEILFRETIKGKELWKPVPSHWFR